jgi:phosphatidylinositol alpha-1,6-mannosyltransferase
LERARFLAGLARAQAHNVDYVLFGHLGLALAQAWVPSGWRRPFAVLLHGVEAWDRSMKAGRRSALQRAGLRIAVSESTARRTRSAHPDVGPILTCPLGLLPEVATSAGGSLDRELIGQLRSPCAVIVGRMSANERYKGHDILLDAWPDVLSTVPGAQLVVVGRGDDVGRLQAKASALGLDDAILFTGFVSDATRAAILQQATCFVLPSLGEGFGLVYLEAMRSALPCLGYRGEAAAEIIRDGKTGVLLQPNDKRDLVQGVAALLANSDLARQMGEAGRNRFETTYTYDCFRSRIEAVLGDQFWQVAAPVAPALSTV